jgi:hypothetical protein
MEIRCIYPMGTNLYVVADDLVLKIDSSDGKYLLGVLSGKIGDVYMEGDGTNIMVLDVASGNGYYYNGTTFVKITSAGFPAATTLTYQDGYFIVSYANRFYLSGSYDPSSWDALDYASAEGKADNIVRVHSMNRDLWLLGEETTEIWFNSGNADFPFERYQGGFTTIGCIAPKSVCSSDERVFWLDNDLRVRMGVGIQSEVISTDQIDYQISQLTDHEYARGFYYIQEGHGFYQLTIGDKTLAYDLTTGIWHTRAIGTKDRRHPANCYAYFDGYHLVGHEDNGKILYFDMDNYTADGEYIRAIRAAQAVHSDRKVMFFNSFELEFEAGTGLSEEICTYSISPETATFFFSEWTALSSNTGMCTITSGSSGSGSSTITYHVGVYTAPSIRTCTITVAGKIHTITQYGLA